MKPGLTLSAGVRYDIEVFPYDPAPLGNPSAHEVSRSTKATSHRASAWCGTRMAEQVGRPGRLRALLRQNAARHGRQLPDRLQILAVVHREFPGVGPDLGPRNGHVPDRADAAGRRSCSQLTPAQRNILNSLYPPGSTVRNTGTVSWDDPDRQQPYFHQISVGYEREIFQGVSASVDYVRMNGRNMFFNPNLNIALGLNDTRDGPRQEPGPDPFGVLRPSLAPGEAMYTGEHNGALHHDAVRLQRLRRAEPVGRKAVLATTSAPVPHIPSAIRAASRPARATRRNCRRSPTCTSTNTRRWPAPTARTTSR